MKRIRSLAFFLAFLMLATLFASCGDSVNDPAESTSDPAIQSSVPIPSQTTTPAVTTSAPEDTGFDGYAFTIGASEIEKYYPKRDESGAYQSALDEEWGKLYEDLETQYNFSFNFEYADNSMEKVTLMLLTGEYPYDVQELRTAVAFPLAARGQIADYGSAEMLAAGLDVTDETLFYQPITQWTNINGGTWGVRFASKFYLPEFGYCMIFNKAMADTAGYPADTLYQMVRDGKWNFSVYKELCAGLVKDTDGDGNYDIWATGGGYNPYASEIMLAGGNAVSYIDGKWVYTLDSAESMDGMQFMYDEFNTFGWRHTGGAGEARTLFSEEQIGMIWAAGFYLTNETITGCEFEYGILPMPKGDNVEDYVDVLSTPIVLSMYAGNLDYDKNVQIMKLWAGVMNSPDNWQERVMEEFCRGNEIDFEMLTEYVFSKLKFGTYKLNSDMEKYIEQNCMNKIYNGELTPAAAVEAVMAQAQTLLDDMFNQ